MMGVCQRCADLVPGSHAATVGTKDESRCPENRSARSERPHRITLPMKTSPHPRRATQGFTLVEMIGVLSVIAILASMLVPRVFQAISDARINNAASTCNSVKSAVNEYYGHYAMIGGTNGSSLNLAAGAIYEDWDLRCLVTEGYMEKPFIVKIGNGLVGSANGGSRMRVINIRNLSISSPVANTLAAVDSGAYNRNGASPTNDVLGSQLVEACIEGVDKYDALDLNNRLDGPTLGAALGANDEAGRVKYFFSSNGLAKVRIYLAHR